MNPPLDERFRQATQAHRQGQLQRAEALYRQFLAEAPQHAEAHHLLGLVCSQQGRHAEAVEHLQQAITLNPQQPNFHHNLGEVWRRQAQLEQAARCYWQALALAPDFAAAHYNLANVLKAQGQLAQAIDHYRQTLDLKPGQAKAHYNLGNALLEQDQLDLAIAHYRQAVQLEPDFAQARETLAGALRRQRGLDEQFRALRQPPVVPGRVGFFLARPFHRAMLDPVYELLKDEFPCLRTADYQEMVAFQPHVLVLADHYQAIFRRELPETIVVWTRHGFASKNYVKPSLEWCDFACLSSEWVRDDYLARGWRPRLGFWVTGFPALDRALRADDSPPLPGLDQLEPGPTLLYAPTWTPELSAIELLGVEWPAALRQRLPQLNLLIKLHPNVAVQQPEQVERHAALAQADPRIILLDGDANIYDYLGAAEVLLTDASSVMFYYLAFDRPIVLINNPRRATGSTQFDPTGPEWAWREIGQEVETVPELVEAVDQALAQPQARAAQRAIYRQRVFGDLADGRAAERIAAKIRALIRPEPDEREWVELAWNSIHSLGQFERMTNELVGRLYQV